MSSISNRPATASRRENASCSVPWRARPWMKTISLGNRSSQVANSSSRRDFPIPASATIVTNPGSPSEAAR